MRALLRMVRVTSNPMEKAIYGANRISLAIVKPVCYNPKMTVSS